MRQQFWKKIRQNMKEFLNKTKTQLCKASMAQWQSSPTSSQSARGTETYQIMRFSSIKS